MKATDVTQHSLDVPKSALAAENPILGTWKLQSLVYEATATGERSSPYGDHPDGYLSYSADGRMYAIGVVEDRPKPRDLVPTDEEKVELQGSMFAYAGTYTADGEKVVHNVDISWNQFWTGTDLVRFYKLDGNTLTITTARAQSAIDGEEGEFTLVWEKYSRKPKTMKANTDINRVAIVGTGLIGSSWAACFLAHGLDVVATDPAPGTEDKVRHYAEAAWPALTKIGLAQGASTSRLRFESNLKEALAGVDMVQENAPEREPLKIKLFAEIDSILPPPAILVSSTSGIPMSRIQSECKHPERCVTGHPFNPPHLIPLVEVVGGAKTSAETIERVMRFYTAMGKRALHIRKEVVGHVANRLSAALYREIAYLIDQDVVSVADADAAVCMGPGLRWALMGPNLIYHLGGGLGGIHAFLEHFTGSMTAYWADLGSPDLASPELQKKIVDGVLEEVDGRSFEALSQERDNLIMGLLELLSHRAKAEPVAASGHTADDS